MFVFDFEYDGTEDIVSLTGNGYEMEAFFLRCRKYSFSVVFYNGYTSQMIPVYG